MKRVELAYRYWKGESSDKRFSFPTFEILLLRNENYGKGFHQFHDTLVEIHTQANNEGGTVREKLPYAPRLNNINLSTWQPQVTMLKRVLNKLFSEEFQRSINFSDCMRGIMKFMKVMKIKRVIYNSEFSMFVPRELKHEAKLYCESYRKGFILKSS